MANVTDRPLREYCECNYSYNIHVIRYSTFCNGYNYYRYYCGVCGKETKQKEGTAHDG